MICTTETRRSFFGSEWVIWRDSQGNEVLRVGVEKGNFADARQRGEAILELLDSCEDTHTSLVAAAHQIMQVSKPGGIAQLNRQRLQDVGAAAMRAASILRERLDTLNDVSGYRKRAAARFQKAIDAIRGANNEQQSDPDKQAPSQEDG